MDRVFSQDDRIRRAEEIYARRQRLNEKTKRVSVNVSEPKNFKLFKRLALQILICILIYYIFHLVNTTNYTFSESAINKTKELLSQDFDFYGVYNRVIESINEFLYGDKAQEANQNAENAEGETKADETQIENQEIIDEESVNQAEVSKAEESETERIKNTYAFIIPASRRHFIRIWGARSYI